MPVSAWLVALGIGVVVAAIALALRSRGLFDIRVRGRAVTLRGRIPGHRNSDVVEFVTGLALPTGSRIRGLPDDGRFRLEFSDQVPAGERQRLRNFLYLHV